MQFAILGPLEVHHQTGRVPLGGLRQRAVLARLLLDAGRVVPAERLVDDVWEGRPPATATKTLQKYVSELRKALPDPVLRTSGGGYVLDIDHDDLDARRFERLVAGEQYDVALALWRGELLADLAGIAFVAPERARLDELRLVATEAALDRELARGRHAAVIGALTELAAAHPLRERLTAMRMVALYRAGRQVEALRVYDEHRRHLADDIGVEPARQLRDLEAAMLRHDPSLLAADLVVVGEPAPGAMATGVPRTVRGNLPLALTSFVGRDDQLAASERALAANRLVTLTGPGGVGKTRVALELGRRLAEQQPGGVWLVDLAGVGSSDRVAPAVAGTLAVDVRHAPDVVTALVAALNHRLPPLLVLDNCEHVVEACASVVGTLLEACAEVRVLATSRRPLGVDGEFVLPIPPLPDRDAVALFADRALSAGAALGEAGAPAEAEAICRRLDSLPLAIELAASQLRVLAPQELATRLAGQLHLGRRAGGVARQRSLHDMVLWSYELLPPATRRVFDRLGVFSSSLTLEAAEAVCQDAELAHDDAVGHEEVLDHVTTLVDHSLLAREPGPASTSRYRLLETLRIFALARLTDAGHLVAARRAHADYFWRLATTAGAASFGPDELLWRGRMDAEEPNLQAALSWTAANEPRLGMRLGVALWPYWDMRWGEREAVAHLERLLSDPELAGADSLRAWGLTVAADLAANPGDARRSLPWAQEAVDLFRRLGDEYGLACALVALGSALGNQGALDEAGAALDEAMASARRRGDAVLEARILNFLSFVATRRGDHALAAALSRDELACWTLIGSTRGEATALRHLAVAQQHLGELDDAAALCRRAMELWVALGDPASVAHVETTLADVARVRGDLGGATRLYDHALVELEAIGDRRCTASTFKNLAVIAARRGEHPRSADLFHRSLLLRRELGDEAGLAECLDGLAGVWAAGGRHAEAVVLLAASASLRERTGALPFAAEGAVADAILEDCRANLGTEDFDTADRRGRALTLDEVLELALGRGVATRT
jgi:predicted ATPase/DNA-binding SARP family transcriptional activator